MRLRRETKERDLRAWAQMVEKILNPVDRARIAVVGKYTELADSYKSIHEALVHGGIANECGVQIDWISSDRFTDQAAAGELLGTYEDRKSTRLNSSHSQISYAVFCLKKKKTQQRRAPPAGRERTSLG